MKKNRKKRSWLQALRNRYRLVVLNDETFEEKASFRLTRLNVYILLSTVLVVVVTAVVLVILYTPLREYLLGYEEVAFKQELIRLRLRVDSLEQSGYEKDLFLANMRNVISGRIDTTRPARSGYEEKYDTLDLGARSEMDSALRASVEDPGNFNLAEPASDLPAGGARQHISDFYFFPPLQGYLTNHYDVQREHYGTDVVAPENSIIKAVLDGTVIFADWTLDAGYVIALQHNHQIVTFYKHNSVLLKKIGNFVRAGEVIAVIGNTGEFTSGTHLHFEMWYNGTPVDPAEYIVFN